MRWPGPRCIAASDRMSAATASGSAGWARSPRRRPSAMAAPERRIPGPTRPAASRSAISPITCSRTRGTARGSTASPIWCTPRSIERTVPSPTGRSRGRSTLSRGAGEGGERSEPGEGLMNDPVVDKIVAHVTRVAADELPEAARVAARAFIADSLGVGIAGAGAPWRREVLDMAVAAGGAPQATVWGTGERLPLAAAAMVNSYQMHALEFDCVHEGAVVHAMSAVLPCLLGRAERDGGVSGERLLRAVVAGIDVAVTLGLCSRAPMRFFRPANCSGFGAVAGLGLLAGLDETQLRDALGIYYGQCAGTMQAHEEASPQLAMQMGFAARSAITAAELAERGMPGKASTVMMVTMLGLAG